MTARMVLRLSVIGQVSSFSSGCNWKGDCPSMAKSSNGGIVDSEAVRLRAFQGLPLQAAQRTAQIVGHGRKAAAERCPAADQYIVTVGMH